MTEIRSVITRGQVGWRNWLGRDIRKPFAVREIFCTLICSSSYKFIFIVKGHQTILLKCCCSVTQSCPPLCGKKRISGLIPWTSACQASLSFTISRNLLKLMSIESMMSSSVTLFFCPQSFPASGSFPMSPSSNQVVKVLELQLQHQSFQWMFRVDFL